MRPEASAEVDICDSSLMENATYGINGARVDRVVACAIRVAR